MTLKLETKLAGFKLMQGPPCMSRHATALSDFPVILIFAKISTTRSLPQFISDHKNYTHELYIYTLIIAALTIEDNVPLFFVNMFFFILVDELMLQWHLLLAASGYTAQATQPASLPSSCHVRVFCETDSISPFESRHWFSRRQHLHFVVRECPAAETIKPTTPASCSLRIFSCRERSSWCNTGWQIEN